MFFALIFAILLREKPAEFERFYDEHDNSVHIVLRCDKDKLPYSVYFPPNNGTRVGDGYDAHIYIKCVPTDWNPEETK